MAIILDVRFKTIYYFTLDFRIIISNNFTIILHVNFVNEMYF